MRARRAGLAAAVVVALGLVAACGSGGGSGSGDAASRVREATDRTLAAGSARVSVNFELGAAWARATGSALVPPGVRLWRA